MDALPADTPAPRRGVGWIHVLWMVLAAVGLTATGTYWVVRTHLYAKDFHPVVLDGEEERALGAKLHTLGFTPGPGAATGGEESASALDRSERLRPERYSEKGAPREVRFNERELNALLARNTELAKKLAIDLSDDLISAKVLVPVQDDFPVLGGKILRVHAGLEIAYRATRPVVILKGVSLMGVPLPGVWLGGIKNVDLVKEFGAQAGFWKAFSDGVEDIRVDEGLLRIRLKK